MRLISTIITLALIFGATVLLVPSVYAEDAPTVTVTGYTVSPSVLMPDSLGTVTITVKNTASTASVSEKTGKLAADDYSTVRTTDINVYIETVRLEGNGIAVKTDNYYRVGEIGPGQSLPFTFTIQAPSSSGIYYPEIAVDTKGGTSMKYPFPVNVNTAIGIQKNAILIMDSNMTGSVTPGDEIPVVLTITNAGQLLADDVTLKVTNVSGKLAPKTTDLFHVGMINPGEQKTVNLVLLSDKQAGYGLVRVPVTVSYNSIDGTPMWQVTGIDVVMKGRAELGFVSVDTSPARLTADTPFDLTIRIENTGTGEAKQVSATIDLPVDGKKEAFIGKIKPGNDAPALFLLEGAKSGSHPYTLTVIYTDDMGEHTLKRDMTLYVPSTDMTGTVITLLIILLIIGAVGYRYWYLPKVNGERKFPWERKS